MVGAVGVPPRDASIAFLLRPCSGSLKLLGTHQNDDLSFRAWGCMLPRHGVDASPRTCANAKMAVSLQRCSYFLRRM